MAKLTVVAALLLCLVAVASANRFTVTTTVMEDDVVENQGSQRCQEQMQRQRLNHCRMYLSRGGQLYGEDLSMVTDDDDDESNQEQEHLQQCCEQLRNFNTQCRCGALRRMMMQERGSRGQESERMMERARYLPRMCNMRPTECRF